jgi:hypothetical protein
MCAPGISAIAGIGMGILQASASYGASQADYQAKMQAWRQNLTNSEAAARDEQRQILTHQMQEQDKTVQTDHISFLQQAQKQSSVEVSAAQGGVSGLSVDNLLSDIAVKSALNRTYADENYKFVAADIQEKLHASDTRLQSRINSVQAPVEPSPLSFIAGVGSSVVGGIKALSSGGGSIAGSFGDA